MRSSLVPTLLLLGVLCGANAAPSEIRPPTLPVDGTELLEEAEQMLSMEEGFAKSAFDEAGLAWPTEIPVAASYVRQGDHRTRLGEATTLPKPTHLGEATTIPKPTKLGEATSIPRPTELGEATTRPELTRLGEATTLPKPTTLGEATSIPKPTTLGEATTRPELTRLGEATSISAPFTSALTTFATRYTLADTSGAHAAYTASPMVGTPVMFESLSVITATSTASITVGTSVGFELVDPDH